MQVAEQNMTVAESAPQADVRELSALFITAVERLFFKSR